MSSTQQLLLGEGAGGAAPVYIEDVFSTYLWTGTGSAQTITNGIDLSTKGGLVWIKSRSVAYTHRLFDTNRGATKFLVSNDTLAEDTNASTLTAFTSSGFSVGTSTAVGENGTTYASWTFREQPKFFDVVTYTGDGDASRRVSHSLASVPGFIIIKRLNASSDWFCYARIDNSTYLRTKLNSFAAGSTTSFDAAKVTSTYFEPVEASGSSLTNTSGGTYVAYLFAHNAGGFGLTGTDNVISCGSYVGTGEAGNNVTLGYEPQWVMTKRATGEGNWNIEDTMRGLPARTASAQELLANSGAVEQATGAINLTSTGFVLSNSSGDYNDNTRTYVYIAIRRGPMKVPTSGTSVFSPVTRTGTGANATISGIPFAPDAIISTSRGVGAKGWMDKLRGVAPYVRSNLTDAEVTTTTNIVLSYTNTGVNVGPDTTVGLINYPAFNFISYFLQRAPSFFDEVCYTGTGVTNRTITHNLTVAPQLLFVKSRSNVQAWSALCTLNSGLQGQLNTSDALSAPSAAVFGNGTSYVAPTASVFTVGTDNETNASGWTYVAYLFATCAGVSKVGSYTGTGTTLQIDCGFTGGARFVMIKRSNSTGDWYFWDSARGIIAGNDPYLLMNSNATEVTSTDYVDTYSAGFEISSTAPAAINASGGTFIFLAIS
jgi:hypothetical protein